MPSPRTFETRQRQAEYGRRHKERYVVAGLCTNCGKPRGEDGIKWLCRPCANRINKSTAAYNRTRRQKRVEERRCPDCKKSLEQSWTKQRCPDCTERRNAVSRNTYRLRLASPDQCTKCGEPALSAVVRLCEMCYLKRTAATTLGNRDLWSALKALWDKQGGRCAYTNAPIRLGQEAVLDHKHPSSRFPEERANLSNVHWVHGLVNLHKHRRTHDEFISLCRHIVAVADGATNESIALPEYTCHGKRGNQPIEH